MFVKPVCVAGRKDPSPKALQFGMLDDVLHQHLADAAAAIIFDHENIADVGECGPVADHAGKGDLPLAVVNAETDRVLDCGSRLLRRSFTSPIGLLDQEPMNKLDIKAALVSVDRILAVIPCHFPKNYGTMTVNSPAEVNLITPAQVHISVLISSSVGKLPSKTVGAPATHGAGVAGMHGAGVNTPKAADVAAITAGFVGAEHIPKGIMLTNGM